MVNERYDEKYEGHEEGEYHFSDDQANYELEGDAPSSKDGTVAAPLPKESIAQKLKNHRRIVIGIIVFIILLSIVYKLVMPSASTPVTDFSQQNASAAASATTTRVTTKVTTPAPPATAPVSTQTQPPVAQQATPEQPTVVPQQPAMNVPPQPVPAQPVAMPQQPVATTPPPSVVTTTTENVANKNPLDRIATLEQQNSAMMNLLETQYTQRIAQTEAQNTQLRTQVQELTSRISSMEVAFQQLTKILRNTRPANSYAGPPMSAPHPMRVSQPRITYTVQAIIPGRAWLKSEAGDTVTVAEGDVLKDLGRITKIDPYDGIVNIDIGNRILTLSYGGNGE